MSILVATVGQLKRLHGGIEAANKKIKIREKYRKKNTNKTVLQRSIWDA